MGRVFQQKYRDKRTGKTRRSRTWTAEWTDAAGATRRKGAGTDKDSAIEFLQKKEREAGRKRLCLPVEKDDRKQARPLTEWLVDYLAELEARDTSADYRKLVKDYAGRVLAGCQWERWSDVTANSLLTFLGKRRKPAGKRKRGNGPATLNSYIRVTKVFTNWLAERLDEKPPLRKMKYFIEAVDLRRGKRTLTDAELGTLLTAAEKTPRRGRQLISGFDRAVLYRVASYTGLRASELQILTPDHFQLDASPPVVTVEAFDAKGRRTEPIPLPAHLVDVLRPWLSRLPPRSLLWPGNWADTKRQADWIQTDLRRAGIPETDSKGRRVTFHSFKRRYVIRLIETGAKIHEVRRLARHIDSKTTLDYYTDTNLPDLGKLADRLPPPG